MRPQKLWVHTKRMDLRWRIVLKKFDILENAMTFFSREPAKRVRERSVLHLDFLTRFKSGEEGPNRHSRKYEKVFGTRRKYHRTKVYPHFWRTWRRITRSVHVPNQNPRPTSNKVMNVRVIQRYQMSVENDSHFWKFEMRTYRIDDSIHL
jgi:hypothetical protein